MHKYKCKIFHQNAEKGHSFVLTSLSVLKYILYYYLFNIYIKYVYILKCI